MADFTLTASDARDGICPGCGNELVEDCPCGARVTVLPDPADD